MNNYFKYILVGFIALLCNSISTNAQSGNISLSGYVSEQIENLPPIAKELLSNKLGQIVTENGISNGALGSRFIITPNINVMNKDIIAGPPPMIAMSMDITFYVGDGVDGRAFASKTISVKGVDVNETKAYISAIKRINPKDPQLTALIEEGKKKIIEYYTNNCDVIIKNAQAAGALGNYEQAIASLTTIPEACKACYEKGMSASEPMYKKFLDRQCGVKLTEARGAWNANQNSSGAAAAGQLLSTIDPSASCYAEVVALNKEIGKRMTEIGDKEWEYRYRQLDAVVEVSKAKVAAYSAITQAFYLSRPTIVYNIRGWW